MKLNLFGKTTIATVVTPYASHIGHGIEWANAINHLYLASQIKPSNLYMKKRAKVNN